MAIHLHGGSLELNSLSCARPMPPRTLVALSVLILVGSTRASVRSPFSARTLAGASETQSWKTPIRAVEYSEIQHTDRLLHCYQIEAPQALATPEPLFSGATLDTDLTVSFIIGTDGRVHSPLILRSGGRRGDREVLRTVRIWQYRPATCNGVPTEAEGKVEFSRD